MFDLIVIGTAEFSLKSLSGEIASGGGLITEEGEITEENDE
jgi:hypothetical protein